MSNIVKTNIVQQYCSKDCEHGIESINNHLQRENRHQMEVACTANGGVHTT